MLVQEIFDSTIYPQLEEYIEAHNDYSAKVTKVNPQDSKKFPIIPVKLLPVDDQYNNLSYEEETYHFGIEINVYSTDVTKEVITTNNNETTTSYEKVAKKTVCDNLTKIITDYMKENYRFKITVKYDAPNVDSNVHRNLITLTGTLDTKYGNDNLVIYPWLL